ncbi:hypothetical protein NM208_g14259 [Fusarium decemcellulare]|uniref:Uncharacterized protein n=1 Tax=Fusarium decemcellulare TaxID=57161 RepID=A0ACC1RHX0_9HYPO|nr:hypothetical protein NM208_g14259 [Fusarium decemcellulare]
MESVVIAAAIIITVLAHTPYQTPLRAILATSMVAFLAVMGGQYNSLRESDSTFCTNRKKGGYFLGEVLSGTADIVLPFLYSPAQGMYPIPTEKEHLIDRFYHIFGICCDMGGDYGSCGPADAETMVVDLELAAGELERHLAGRGYLY